MGVVAILPFMKMSKMNRKPQLQIYSVCFAVQVLNRFASFSRVREHSQIWELGTSFCTPSNISLFVWFGVNAA